MLASLRADAGQRRRECCESYWAFSRLLPRPDRRTVVDGAGHRAFLVFIGLQWWAFWYPGAEPGGGGYIAQRIFSASDENQGLLSVLWFNVAHYAIAAVAVDHHRPGGHRAVSRTRSIRRTGYMMVLNAAPAARSIAASRSPDFLAAFMSTVATQLNWGASYLVADFYRRFMKKHASERHYVVVSRLCTVLLVIVSAWVSVQLGSIGGGWQVVLEIGAGTGAVYMLRWYWWRINAWSEISAMACSLLVTLVLNRWQPFAGNSSLVFAKSALATTVVTTIVWLDGHAADQARAGRGPAYVSTATFGPTCADGSASLRKCPMSRRTATWAAICWRGCWAARWSTCACLAPARFCCISYERVALLAGSAVCAVLLYRGVVRNFRVEPEASSGSVPNWIEAAPASLR